MEIFKYEGENYQEVMNKIAAEMGREAVILHTRTRQKKSWLGLRRKQIVEVTVSRGLQVPDRKPHETPLTRRLKKTYKRGSSEGLLDEDAETETKRVPLNDPALSSLPVDRELEKAEALRQEARRVMAAAPKPKPSLDTLDETKSGKFEVLKNEIGEVKLMLNSLLTVSKSRELSDWPDELREAYLYLLEREISEDLSKKFVNRLKESLKGDAAKNRDIIREKLRLYVREMIRSAGPIEAGKGKAKSIMFVGPTGVGKTTTISKLAANFQLIQGRKVGLVTQDTYRLAAVEQLKTTADILHIPIEVVHSPGEMPEAMEKLSDCDIILVDTAGRSQNNTDQLKDLEDFLKVSPPDEIHLVLDATTADKTLLDIVQKFSRFQPTHLVLTKLDEALAFGVVLNLMAKVDQQLSYITYGQEVPEDFEAAKPDRLADLILGKAKLPGIETALPCASVKSNGQGEGK